MTRFENPDGTQFEVKDGRLLRLKPIPDDANYITRGDKIWFIDRSLGPPIEVEKTAEFRADVTKFLRVAGRTRKPSDTCPKCGMPLPGVSQFDREIHLFGRCKGVEFDRGYSDEGIQFFILSGK